MKFPLHPLYLKNQVYRNIMPTVHGELDYWKKRAEGIRNEELREQALASIHMPVHAI